MHCESVGQVGGRLRSGEVTSAGLTELMLERIDAHNPALNAYITVTADLAREQAERADVELRGGRDRGPLHGIPVAVKDLFATRGVRTTCGSKLFEDWIPDFDATAVTKLREAGAVMLGKTGLHELAYGSTSINQTFGSIANPWALDRDPGGSSGGSASAVAAGLAYAALGTDTGCSVRQPAHCCGIVGYKPTFGLVSKAGALPLVRTMDHVGPLARTVEGVAAVLAAIAGYDQSDPYSVLSPVGAALDVGGGSIRGTRIGVVRGYFFEGHADVINVVDGALETLRCLGAEIIELEISGIDEASTASGITFAEAATVHRDDLDERPEAFGDDILDKLAWSSKVTAADYIEAQVLRRGFVKQMEELLTECDVLAAPTATATALPISDRPDDGERNSWKNTQIFNFTGHPSISLPCGLTESALPVGLMLTGKMFHDREVLRAAHAIERGTNWHERNPDL